MPQRLTTKKATIIQFRRSLCIGTLVFNDGTSPMDFCSVCFHSSPARFPREGEEVEVVIDADTKKLILVRDIRTHDQERSVR